MSARDVLVIGSTPKGLDSPSAYDRLLDFYMELLGLQGDNDYPTPAIPLYEDDPHWVRLQLEALGRIGAVSALKRVRFGEGGGYARGVPFYRADQLDSSELDLRFEKRARDYYPTFIDACRERGLNETPRLQVGVNTLDLAIFAFWGAAGKHYPALLEATKRELAEVWELASGKAFFLLESPLSHILGNLTMGRKDLRNWFVDRLVELVEVLPEGAGWGLHLCNGDLDHESVFVPRRMQGLETSVWFASTFLVRLEEKGARLPELVQIPLARGKQSPSLDLSYYGPLKSLRLPDEVQLFAGLMHEGRTLDQLTAILHYVDQLVGQHCGISNSCGFGRMSVEAMQYCLNLSTRLAST